MMSGILIESDKYSKKKDREEAMQRLWLYPMPHDFDIIDHGNHISIVSCTSDVVGWWVSKLRALYPQDVMGDDGTCIKINPANGVTVKIIKDEGTLKIKGKRHLEWLIENLDGLIGHGDDSAYRPTEMTKQCDHFLNLSESHTVQDLLLHLPESGAFRDGRTYIYRLWRALLDSWIHSGGDVYIVSPLLDSIRLADILMLLIKHKLSKSRVHLYTMDKCEPDQHYSKIFKEAKNIIREVKGPNKKRLVTEERLNHATQKLETRFGRVYCKLIAVCLPEQAEILVTSASFHKWHFDLECGDTVVYFELTPANLINNYLAPLGLSRQAMLESSGLPSPVDEQCPSEHNHATRLLQE